MRQIISVTFVTVFLLTLFSCKDESVMQRKISGKPGDLIVVVPKETWEGKVGDAMKKVFLQPQAALPQDEPLFTTIDIPPAAFKDIFKTTRNIINVRISPTLDSAKVELKENVWAWPQAVVNVQAKTADGFVALFNLNSERILAFLLKAERDRLQMNYAKSADKAIKNVVRKKFNIDLNVPVGFTIAVNQENFVWLRYDTPDITQSIAIYTFPYQSDSTFTSGFLLHKRDSVMKKNVGGSLPGSYMTTEHRVPPIFQVFRLRNNYSAEMRGLWKLEKDFMGGPYVNLSVLDISNGRVVVLDGFVYAPRLDKRNYLRQVEAMIYSLQLPDQEKNDKISSQLEMGNE
ncbi:MAG: DUF4837 family protein [Mangrovibacterium sp.]|nr:DUF4837 family protein [Mangrovibacterium sp.]